MLRLAAAFLAGCLLLTGCDQRAELPSPDAAPDTAVGPAQRIITLAPHLTELVYSAGAGDRIVGVVEYSDFPLAALEQPRIGDAFRLDYETITELMPDLVLAWTSGTPQAVQERLRDMGLRVVPLYATSLDSVGRSLSRIGELTGTQSIADAAAAAFDARLQTLRTQHAADTTVAVFYQIASQPLFTITARHVINDAIEVCGGRNIFADIPGVSPAISLESVIAAEPDVIVAGKDAIPGGEAALRKQWGDWTSIPAVRNGLVVTVDADRMHRTTLRILDAVEQLCAHLDAARSSAAPL